MAKYLPENVQYLANCLKDASGSQQQGGRAKPFSFLIGAGASKSAGIPLAWELVREIHDNQKYARHLRQLTESERGDYALCMGALTQEERRELLTPYLDNAMVNWASLGLASLLKRGYIERLLTFNFDNVIARACGICGHYPAIYDFSVNPPSDFGYMKQSAIVHLHGQGSGLSMLNSRKETKHHADELVPLFTDVLANNNLIVMGYSGKSDAAFEKFRQVYKGRNRLFWLGRDDDPEPHIKEMCEDWSTFQYYGGADADRFMIELAQALECWPPVLFTDPEQHLLEELEPIIPYPEGLPGEDILSALRRRLRSRIAKRDAHHVNFNQLLLAGKYAEVIARKNAAIGAEDKEAVAWAYIMQGNELSALAKLQQKPELFEQSIAKYREALAIKPDSYEALNNWGTALSNLARLQQKPELFEQSFEKYAAALALKPESHEALNNWGGALSDLAQLQQRPELFEQSFEKHKAALALKPDKHEALNNWGAALSGLAQLQQKPELFEQSIEKYKAALALKPDKHEALSNWGAALSNLARLQQKPELFEQSIEKYKEALALKPDKHEALNNWGAALLSLAQLQQKPELVDIALAKCLEAEKITGIASYNVGCAYALKGDEEACKAQLLRCKADKTLPDRTHLDKDENLAAYRDRDWFKAL